MSFNDISHTSDISPAKGDPSRRRQRKSLFFFFYFSLSLNQRGSWNFKQKMEILQHDESVFDSISATTELVFSKQLWIFLNLRIPFVNRVRNRIKAARELLSVCWI